MATIIDLAEARARRQERRRSVATGCVFAFDLASPRAYLAAPTVAERFPHATWVPIHGGPREIDTRHDVEATAAKLGVDLTWPVAGLAEGRMAARVAAAAAEDGDAQPFALAALRLAYAHGEDLDDLGTLATAAGIAGLDLQAVLDAAFDPRRDAALERAAQTSSRNTISVESERRGPSLRMRV